MVKPAYDESLLYFTSNEMVIMWFSKCKLLLDMLLVKNHRLKPHYLHRDRHIKQFNIDLTPLNKLTIQNKKYFNLFCASIEIFETLEHIKPRITTQNYV